MIKIFISQPMRGKTDSQIIDERKQAIEKIKNLDIFKGQDVEFIDSILSSEERQNANHSKHPRVYNLGESLKLLSQADYVVLLPGFDKAEGCVVEGFTANVYGIKTIKL